MWRTVETFSNHCVESISYFSVFVDFFVSNFKCGDYFLVDFLCPKTGNQFYQGPNVVTTVDTIFCTEKNVAISNVNKPSKTILSNRFPTFLFLSTFLCRILNEAINFWSTLYGLKLGTTFTADLMQLLKSTQYFVQKKMWRFHM